MKCLSRQPMSPQEHIRTSAQIPGLTSMTVSLLKQPSNLQKSYLSDPLAHSAAHIHKPQLETHCTLPPFRQTIFKVSSGGTAPLWTYMRHVHHSRELLAGTRIHLKGSDGLILVKGVKQPRRRRKSLCIRHAP